MRSGRGLVLLAALLLAGCRSAGTSPEAGSPPAPGSVSARPGEGQTVAQVREAVRVRSADLDTLVLLVPTHPSWSNPGRCEPVSMGLSGAEETRLAMSWTPEAGPRRRVTVTFDQNARPVDYSDLRGSLARVTPAGGGRAGEGAGTRILLNLRSGLAIIMNKEGAEETVGYRVRPEDALSSEKLGDPSSNIVEIFNRCGGERVMGRALDDGTSPPGTGLIFGRVVDLRDGGPVEYIDVAVEEEGIGAVTDAEGLFWLKDVPLGSLRVRFFHPCFHAVEMEVELTPVVKTRYLALGIPYDVENEVSKGCDRRVGGG